MNFLGRKLRGNFEGEIVSDLSDFAGRIPGCRIKHRLPRFRARAAGALPFTDAA